MPYIKAKSPNMQKVFLDLNKIPGQTKKEKKDHLGISFQLMWSFVKYGTSIKNAKKKDILKYMRRDNEK